MTKEEYDLLSKYAWLDGTEVGGYVTQLLCLRDSTADHGMTAEFSDSLDLEIDHWMTRFKNETEIVTKAEPQPDRVIQELVWYEG